MPVPVLSSPLSRRTLLKGLSALAAPTLVPAAADSASGMFLALNSVLIKGRVKWPEFVTLAKQAGFPGADVDLTAAMKAGAESTRALLQRSGIRPAAINFPVEFRKDEATFQAGLSQLDEQSRFAAAIGCPRMVTYIVSSSDTPTDELRALYRDRFARCASVMARSQVRLGLEFLGPLQFRKLGKYPFIYKMDDMLQLAKDSGPNVGLLLDSWHWHHAGATADDIINAGKSRIVHVHFNDAPNLPPEQIRDNQRLLPGEGVIDLTTFLKALQQIGYSDALSVEVFGRMDKETPQVAAREGYKHSAAVFRKAGIPLASDS